MISRIDQRKQAYQFILDKIKKLEAEFSYQTNISDEVSYLIPLAELDKLRRGIADPSIKLVNILKKMLHPVASEIELEDNLLKPFQFRATSLK